MKTWTSAVAAAALAFALAPVVLARFNARAPHPRDNAIATVVGRGSIRMVAEKNLDVARLEIPGWLAEDMKSDATGSAAGSIGGPGISPMQTVASGVSLSLALVLGGLWLRRAKSGPRRQVVGVVLAGAVLVGAGGVATANLGPAPRYSGNLTKAMSPGAELQGPLQIVIVPDATEVRLVVPAQSAKGD
jgi:hypothetical protein